MSVAGTIVAMVVVLAIAWRYLGSYLVAVYERRTNWLGVVERPIYRLIGVDPEEEQTWQRYGISLVVFTGVRLLIGYGLLRLQGHLPLSPQHLPGVAPALAWNTVVSFVTNTDWQNYSGETTMSYAVFLGGRHDRGRHERRPRPRPGGRRRRHEHRYHGRQGGREHGRPRLQPDQAHRHRRDRQAAPHHPRRALTTFSIANDVAKYFAIIPALFVATYAQLQALNVMGLHSPESAVLSAVILNALVIVALIPLALRGVRFRAEGAAAILRRNVWIYGVGGLGALF
jgi:hypothetical protein